MTVAELYKMACIMGMENTELIVNAVGDAYSVTFDDNEVQINVDYDFPESFKAPEPDNSAWDFQWSGRGNYETERRAFYGDFS